MSFLLHNDKFQTAYTLSTSNIKRTIFRSLVAWHLHLHFRSNDNYQQNFHPLLCIIPSVTLTTLVRLWKCYQTTFCSVFISSYPVHQVVWSETCWSSPGPAAYTAPRRTVHIGSRIWWAVPWRSARRLTCRRHMPCWWTRPLGPENAHRHCLSRTLQGSALWGGRARTGLLKYTKEEQWLGASTVAVNMHVIIKWLYPLEENFLEQS